MTNTMYILITILVITTINTLFSLYQLWSVEKERVKSGYPAYSDFDYYYQIFPYLGGLVYLIFTMIISSYLPEPKSLGYLILACLIYNFIYFLINLLVVFILSVIQARLVRRG
nr:MAG TPA: hypothetical protein [Herelleviridae sp.]